MQKLEEFLTGVELSLHCREITMITEPWRPKQYLCELHGSNGDDPITAMVGSDDGPPALPEVLDVVAAEAAVVGESRRFEEWAVQMGYNPDSRHVERVYRTERAQARRLRLLLGDEAYEELLFQTERL
jgi:hypothetical protein